MIGKIVILAFLAGHNALTLQADDQGPVDFSRQTEASLNSAERMNLVRTMRQYSFEDFIGEHGREYVKGTNEYKKRAAVFYKRKAETLRLAGLPGLDWIPALNKFMDHTKPEIQARLGYRPVKKASGGVAFGRKPMDEIPSSWNHPARLSWVPNMTFSQDFQKDQGACGSCWAVACTAAAEAHADVHFGVSVPLSAQQLVSCTPNPKHCGGKGGCDGATAELAYDYAAGAGGMVGEHNYEYTSMWGDSGSCLLEKTKSPTVLLGGYTSVPQNNHKALMYAITTGGPVIVAVDASSWSFYGAGIFNSCKRDATLNHAVLLVGYGAEERKGYWMIRNSWGKDWGLKGYIKLSRAQSTKNKEPASFCGTDYHPEEGSACEGDSTPVKVCGMCGILYEPVLPIVTGINKPDNFDQIIADVKAKNLQKELEMQKRREQPTVTISR